MVSKGIEATDLPGSDSEFSLFLPLPVVPWRQQRTPGPPTNTHTGHHCSSSGTLPIFTDEKSNLCRISDVLILFPGLYTIEPQVLLRPIWKKVLYLYHIELGTCLHISDTTHLTQQLLCSEKADGIGLKLTEKGHRDAYIQVTIFQNPLYLFFFQYQNC